MVVFAQVSDTHLDDGEKREVRAARTAAVVRYLGRMRGLDAVLVTGDVADHGRAGEYAQAAALFGELAVPVLWCPGNHDVRAAFRVGLLGEAAADGPVDRVGEVGGTVFALCDSSVPGRDDGWLDDRTLEWLDGVLEERRDRPAFVCFHHPPVRLGSPYGDSIRLFGEERLAAVLERHPQVVAVLCGHAHTPAASTFAGRPVLVAPGVASTLVLPWEGDGIADEGAPVAVAFHVLDGERRLATHYRVVGDTGREPAGEDA